MHTILLFVDGLGWGAADPAVNPQLSYGGSLFAFPRYESRPDGLFAAPRSGLARPIDAVLGVEGVPQSATGQTTLLSGVNAQAALGKHLTGFPNDRLRGLLLEHSILRRFTLAGRRARFLNAFRPRFFELPRERQLQFSATTVSNLAGDLPFYRLEDVAAGRSVYQDFTNRELIDRGFDVAPMAPSEAGRILARRSQRNDFTLYEYFQSDKAGHSAEMDRCRRELVMLDEFLTALLDTLEAEGEGPTLVVLCSDHGNLEDLSTRRHTTNPVPLAMWGADAEETLRGVERLDQVAGALLARHGLGAGPR